jgi:hypothetical protein
VSNALLPFLESLKLARESLEERLRTAGKSKEPLDVLTRSVIKHVVNGASGE